MIYIPKHQVYVIPNPHNIPVHDQGEINNCTSHAYALGLEYSLSRRFNERTLIDVNDLWEKQKKYGTATDNGDRLEGPFLIADNIGVKFVTDSGKTGIYLRGRIIWYGSLKYYLQFLKNLIFLLIKRLR